MTRVLALFTGFLLTSLCCGQAANPAWQERKDLQKAAQAAFQDEMNREKAGDCPGAQTTYDFNFCYTKETAFTDRNLRRFEAAIRALLLWHRPGEKDEPSVGPAGPHLSREQRAAEFDHLEQSWRSYLQAAGTAAFHQFGGGTGGPSFAGETQLVLVRSHMRELNHIYYMSIWR